MEITEYAVFDLFLEFFFRFPSLPRNQQTFECKSIYKLKEQIEKDAKIGRMRKKYKTISTVESIQFGVDTLLKDITLSFNNTDAIKVEVTIGQLSRNKAFLAFEVVETKN